MTHIRILRKLRSTCQPRAFALCWCAVICLTSTHVLAGTYYVDTNSTKASDSNPGTAALPWKTISKAASAMVAGDTTLVSAGKYGGVVTVRSGSSGKPITFIANGTVDTGSWTFSHDYITMTGFRLPARKLL